MPFDLLIFSVFHYFLSISPRFVKSSAEIYAAYFLCTPIIQERKIDIGRPGEVYSGLSKLNWRKGMKNQNSKINHGQTIIRDFEDFGPDYLKRIIFALAAP